jgi:hypothetical protein
MRPGLRSQVIRPRRHPRIDPSPIPMDSRELCLAALFACARLFSAATHGRKAGDAEARHEAARQLLLARAAASPWVVPPPRRERFVEMVESLDGLDGEPAQAELVRFPAAFLTLLERRHPPERGEAHPRRRQEDRMALVAAAVAPEGAGPRN